VVEEFKRLRHRKLIAAILGVLFLVAAGLMIAQDQETLRIQAPLAADDAAFPRYLARLLGRPLTRGDSYIVHTNGDDAFPAMLAAINGAASRVALETYIFDGDATGQRFQKALANAARRGVQVHVVLDSVGAGKMKDEDIAALQSAGVHIGWYNRVASFSLEEANYRTHRKELVVDGRVAFVGGMGLADQWATGVDGQPQWRDTQIELHGPVVDNVEAGFNENWIETGGVVTPQVETAPAAPASSGESIVVWSSPEGGANGMKLLYLLAIGSARRTLDIESPYVITDESTQWSLRAARQRGVRVRILMDGDLTDAKPVKFAGRADYETLLREGIELYEYQPSMLHTKALVVDGVLSIVGSANFDNRSLELNDELNVAAFDRGLAARLLADFERDRTRATQIDLERWRSRPLHIRGREKAWNLFGEIF
jgi:cardiolipin synthase